ncbi:3-deoxy-8-phosphooctulonate synthase [bacterium]|nr:3-deoxy-8-phosphooctulonate synthase [bacterium]
MNCVKVNNISIGDGNPLVLIAGPCVIESEKLVLETADSIRTLAEKLKIPFIFKSSYRKDNRSSARSYQGLSLKEGLRALARVRSQVGVPVISDIHDAHDADRVADVLDIIQIPAYLCMQTSLVLAAARTGKPVNIKKGQFLAPEDVRHIVGKIEGEGNRNILLTERGSCFGYHNLVVDMRSFQIMRETGYPVVFDPTHAIRVYGISSSDPRGGTPQYVPALSRAAVAAGIDALFIETHPDCRSALCDAASMWPLQNLEELLVQVLAIDQCARSQKAFKYPGGAP